ncbi:hypothetical protein QFZ27_000190 [Inquilinus ginsengisoli]|jgi:hypothetical protein|uniref:hypothetical protein n=1 Tax=Inquilinus ginsengisoli TaxID=363840 RepID=UPI003D1B6C89
MTSPATRSSWKTMPCPTFREDLGLSLTFSDADGEKLRLGHIPEDMDDKWFIFFQDGWLYFHRSWTGDCIFGLRLDGFPSGVRVVESWASRDKERYNSVGVERERELVRQLIRTRLLSQPLNDRP